MEDIIEYLREMTERGDQKAKELLDLHEYHEDEMFIVVAQHRIDRGHTLEYSDSWTSHDDIKDARECYNKHIIDDSCYTASICRVVDSSTDYFTIHLA